jgi:1-acyl-sn-glycerol-3-phosphate acyltransferase
VSELRYPVPWDLVFSLAPHIARRTQAPTAALLASLVDRMPAPPLFHGLENIPASPPFVIAANHYQRRGLWIAHSTAAIAHAVAQRTPRETPFRWLVTANFPPLRLGPWKLPSPGDLFLPHVARALGYFCVPFAASNPARTARSLLAALRQAPRCVLGIYPEGAQAGAASIGPPLPGMDRLFRLLAQRNLPILPARISGNSTQFVIEFLPPVSPAQLAANPVPATTVMDLIAQRRPDF